MQTCKKCGEEKPLEDFHKDKTLKNGRKKKCKVCVIGETTEWNRANTDKRTAAQYRWREKNPEVFKALSVRTSSERRARMLGTKTGYLTPDFVTTLMKFYKKCLKCGSTENLQVDHVIPLALGGTHELKNFQILCGSCNATKGARNSEDYRGKMLMWFIPTGPVVVEGTQYIKVKETT